MSCQSRLIVSLGGICILALLIFMTVDTITLPMSRYQMLGALCGFLVGSILTILLHTLLMAKTAPKWIQWLPQRPPGPVAISSRQIALISVSGVVGGRFFVAVLTPAQLDGFILFISISMTIFIGYVMVYGLSRP